MGMGGGGGSRTEHTDSQDSAVLKSSMEGGIGGAASSAGNKKKSTSFPQMRRVALNMKSAAGNAVEAAGTRATNLLQAIRTEAQRRRNRLQRTTSGTALTVSEDIMPQMLLMWKEKKLDDLPVAKDVPRLIRRISILDDNDTVLWEAPAHDSENEVNTSTRYVELTCELILALTKELEGRKRMEELAPQLKAIASKVKDADETETHVREMFRVCGDEASAAIRALKTVHQDMVGHCTLLLKEHITSRFMTKDVRTPNGWRIHIKVADDAVRIFHVRREQSIEDAEHKHNHWEFCWELKLLFDPKVNTMVHAQLRVTDLFLDQGIDPELEEAVKKDLLGGG
jgi:hypothetical protein